MKHVGVRQDEFGNLFFFYIYFPHDIHQHQSDILDPMPFSFFPFVSPPPPMHPLIFQMEKKKNKPPHFAGKNWKEVMAYRYTPPPPTLGFRLDGCKSTA